MYEGKTIAVVVPAYNEEKLLGQVLKDMPELVDVIIVVNDASTDQTAEVVLSYRRLLGERMVLLCHEQNQGVGGALVTGYKHAMALGIDVTVVMDGDAQMAPEDLARVIAPVARGEADYVKGNRLFRGEAWEMIPHNRYLGNAVLSLLTKVASGYWHIADSQSGYTAISRTALQAIPLKRLYRRYGVYNDILIKLNVADFRVRNVSVRPIYNIGEISGIRLHKVIPTISWLLLRGFFWRLKEKYVVRDFHPLVFFYCAALTLLPSGLLFGALLMWQRLFVGRVPATSALFAALLTLSGLQLLLFAMWFDMEHNKHLR
jgi:glycosyltransferase involved in cell wall biosynthesis